MGSIREKKRASTKEALLESGRKLFNERGYEKTTVDDIAENAVISKFTFYSYFQSKEELLDELHLQGLNEALAPTSELLNSGVSVTEIILLRTEGLADWYDQNKELAMVLLNQRRMPLFNTGPDSCLNSLSDLIKHAQTLGELSGEVSPQDIAKYLYLIAFGEKMSWVQAGCNYSLKEKMLTVTKFLLKALKPQQIL